MMQWWTDMVLGCSLRVLLDLHRMFTETDFRSELDLGADSDHSW